ncbi:MAG TPA: carboxypeptidase regulatory-like domain-containing protein, partial [Bryobacteraceae bacterium]|nr:carboxypeptidase regulatory-like domain-containing protein [Bryobacteraceae bacterium]
MGIIVSVVSLAAQTSRGTLTGIVTDAQGAAMPGAQVSLRNEETNVRRQTTANEAGLYRFDAIDPGQYQISVEAAGFRTYSKRQIPVGAAQTVSNDVQLEVGETQQTVEVVAQTESALQYEAPVRGGNMGSREIVNLPLPNRRPSQLAFTIPGVVSNRFSSNGSLTGFSVNGARQRSNNFMIDGTENNDISVSGEGLTISNPDVVAEVNIQTTNYDAEFGRAGGAVVNIITKSGTNQYHGTLNYVLDSTYDDALTNSQSLDPELQARGRPAFGIEQFWGGTFGGPIRKDRTFFFGSFQEDRLRSNSTRVLNTLSAQGRATLNSLFPKGTNPNVDLYNALTAGVDATSRFSTLEMGNGRPAIEVGTAVQGLSTSTIDRQYLGRLDHKLSDSDQLSGRFIYQTIDIPNGALFNVFPGFEADSKTKNVSVSLTETHIFSPTLTNELRLNYMRLNPLFPVSNPDNELVRTAPQIAITGLTNVGLDNRFPQGRYGNNYQLQDTATFVHGKHSIRFGGDILHQRSKQFAPIAARGALDIRASTGFS